MTGREVIAAALFAKLAASAGFVTTGRKLKTVADLSPVQQPALFLLQGRQSADAKYRLPTKWQMHFHAYIYGHAQSPGADGNAQMLLNNLLDGVDAALAPDPATPGEQTLGGLVSHCAIDGEVDTDEGLLGDQAVAVVPITVIPFPASR